MPKIRISFIQLVDEILVMPKSKEKIVEIWEHILMNGFLFNEFTLVVEGDSFLNKIRGKEFKHTYKVKIEGYGDNQKIYIKCIKTDKNGLAHTTKIITSVPRFLEGLKDVIKDCAKLGLEQFQEWDVDKEDVEIMPPMLFMQYAVNKAMNPQEVIEMPVTSKVYKPISERKKSKQKTEYKLFDVIRKYSQHLNKNKHNMTCERWDVKGHFRHYKNGKVVYIKPFEKGKGRKKERNYTI